MSVSAIRSEDKIGNLLEEAKRAVRVPLAQAKTLPPECFTDPDFYQQEVDHIFRKEWLCAGHVSQVRNPGDYFTLTLLGEDLVITRDRDGNVNALSSVCRHRWMPVAEGAGNTSTLSCPYHKWTYALDGQLMGAPLMEQAEGFDKKKCSLPKYACEIWNGWIFVSFDENATPLAEKIPSLTEELLPWPIDELEVAMTLEFDSPFNWKVLIDNFMEAYHHFAIHPQTFEEGYPAAISTCDEVEEPYSVLRCHHLDNAPIEPFFQQFEGVKADQTTYFSPMVVYPYHLFAINPDMVTWYHIIPEAVDRFKLKIYTLLPKEIVENPEMEPVFDILRETINQIHHEDIFACEGVWKGLQSARAEAGRLSHLEATIWEHHNWILDRIEAAQP